MAKNKNQHYVPQLHLRNFSTDAKKKLINVYHLSDQKHIKDATIKSQASERYFYGNDGILEDALGEIETLTSTIFKKIIDDHELPKPKSEEHFTLLLFVLLSKSRTKKELDKLNEFENLMLQKVMSYDSRFGDKINQYRFEMKNSFGMILGIAGKHCHLALDLKYKLIINKSDTPFIISDHPAVTYNDFNNQKGREITNGRGYVCKGLQIIFPLTPEISILFYDSWAYKVGTRRQRNVIIESRDSAEFFNLLQILNAYEVLFFNDKTDIHRLELLIEKSKLHDRFDIPGIKELGRRKHGENDGILLGNETTSPKVKFVMESYKLLDRAKMWKPDDRIVYPRTNWHYDEMDRIRNKEN